MNLQKLFEIQAKLDKHIVKGKGLEGQNLLEEKILALQVELGELANEWRGFKFWSNDQKPRTKLICKYCEGNGYTEDWHGNEEQGNLVSYPEICNDCGGIGIVEEVNPLLEEYVDCLHFILGIGIEINYEFGAFLKWQSANITSHFNDLFHAITTLRESIESDSEEEEKQENFNELLAGFLGLGDMLGFTWEQIEQAYLDKNKINHERQLNGY